MSSPSSVVESSESSGQPRSTCAALPSTSTSQIEHAPVALSSEQSASVAKSPSSSTLETSEGPGQANEQSTPDAILPGAGKQSVLRTSPDDVTSDGNRAEVGLHPPSENTLPIPIVPIDQAVPILSDDLNMSFDPEFLAMLDNLVQLDNLKAELGNMETKVARLKAKKSKTSKRSILFKRSFKWNLERKEFEAINEKQKQLAEDAENQLTRQLTQKTEEYKSMVAAHQQARESQQISDTATALSHKQTEESYHRVKEDLVNENEDLRSQLSAQTSRAESFEGRLIKLQMEFDNLQTSLKQTVLQQQPSTPPQSPPIWSQDEFNEAKMQAENVVIGKLQFHLRMANIKLDSSQKLQKQLQDDNLSQDEEIQALRNQVRESAQKHKRQVYDIEKTSADANTQQHQENERTLADLKNILDETKTRVTGFEQLIEDAIKTLGEQTRFAGDDAKPLKEYIKFSADEISTLRAHQSSISNTVIERDSTIECLWSGISARNKEIRSLERELQVATAAQAPPIPEEKKYLARSIESMRAEKTIELGDYLDVKQLKRILAAVEDDLEQTKRREKVLLAQLVGTSTEAQVAECANQSTGGNRSIFEQTPVADNISDSEEDLAGSLWDWRWGSPGNRQDQDTHTESGSESPLPELTLIENSNPVVVPDLLDEEVNQVPATEVNAADGSGSIAAATSLDHSFPTGSTAENDLTSVDKSILAPRTVVSRFDKLLFFVVGIYCYILQTCSNMIVTMIDFSGEKYYDALEEQAKEFDYTSLPNSAKFLLLSIQAAFTMAFVLYGTCIQFVELDELDSINSFSNIGLAGSVAPLWPVFNYDWPVYIRKVVRQIVTGTHDGRGPGDGSPSDGTLQNIAGWLTREGWLPR